MQARRRFQLQIGLCLVMLICLVWVVVQSINVRRYTLTYEAANPDVAPEYQYHYELRILPDHSATLTNTREDPEDTETWHFTLSDAQYNTLVHHLQRDGLLIVPWPSGRTGAIGGTWNRLTATKGSSRVVVQAGGSDLFEAMQATIPTEIRRLLR